MSIFSSIRGPRVKRTSFNLSHHWCGTLPFGKLVPFLCQDVVPNDKFYISSEVLVETFPMLADIYSQVDVKCEYFFVPNRLIMDGWEDFITGGPDGSNSSIVPQVVAPTFDVDASHLYGTLWDYFGMPINKDSANNVVFDTMRMPIALPFRAYRKIWNDWYRNENLQDELALNPTDFDATIQVFERNWKKDYFTSALPFVQRGPTPLIQVTGSDVSFEGSLESPFGPLIEGESKTTSIVDPVMSTDWTSAIPNVFFISSYGGQSFVQNISRSEDGKEVLGDTFFRLSDSFAPGYYRISPGSATGTVQVTPIGSGTYSSATLNGNMNGLSFDINELRRVNAVQRWLERNARAGARYVEQIASHFGVRVPDYRLQRSEFIGGTTQPLRISSIMQTNTPSAEPTYTDALGYEAGKGISSGITKKRKYRVPEHGWIIGLVSIVPRAFYNQGLDKKFMRYDRFDYYFPEFAHLGEEPVYNQELFYGEESDPSDPSTFGYQSRYASYKWQKSAFTGDFRDSMNFYTLGREFSSLPQLNSSFIQLDSNYSNLNRVFSVPSNPRPFKVYINNHVLARRPMPKYGTPKL